MRGGCAAQIQTSLPLAREKSTGGVESETGQGVDSDDRILSDHLASLASLMGLRDIICLTYMGSKEAQEADI